MMGDLSDVKVGDKVLAFYPFNRGVPVTVKRITKTRIVTCDDRMWSIKNGNSVPRESGFFNQYIMKLTPEREAEVIAKREAYERKSQAVDISNDIAMICRSGVSEEQLQALRECFDKIAKPRRGE